MVVTTGLVDTTGVQQTETRDAAKHPSNVQNNTPQQRITGLKMSRVSRLRNE